jgi:hypothetical protein
MSTHEGCVLADVSACGSRTRRRTVRRPTIARKTPPQKSTKRLPAVTPSAAQSATASHGMTRNGATMFTLCSTPKRIGSVTHPPARSPSMSA